MDKQSVHNVNAFDKKKWQEFQLDCMTDAERIAFLEQLLEDEVKMSNLASLEFVRMPEYLEEEMLEAILGEASLQEIPSQLYPQEVSDLQKRNYRPPKWLQLFSYSIKITFAAACAVVALFRMPDMGVLKRVNAPDSLTEERNTARESKREQDLRKWEQEVLEWELAALEREQETIAREAEAVKRQQELLAEKEQRQQQEGANTSLVADTLQFITNKIFIGGMNND